jgi:hypothetical protein
VKRILIVVALLAAAIARAAIFTNGASADTFVRSLAPSSNYGASGADSISGANATNAIATANGAFDTFIRFNTFSMVTNFNALFGSNNWVINGATLQLTEQSAPANNLFNRGKGSFEVRWIANDNWIEGTGNPSVPASSGLVYTNETALLNVATDSTLGVFTNAGTDSTQVFALSLPGAFVGDMQAGGEVGMFMTAIDPNIGFTFSSRTFITTNGRPFLIVSAIPQPAITAVNIVGVDLVLSCSNGALGSTYRVLANGDLSAPRSQWTALSTNTLAANGAFTLTVSNAVSGSSSQFFVVQVQ